MPEPDLKKLPPEERIKRLKELEQKRKQEIEEAQKMIRETQDEITQKRKWLEKVPIPELAKEDLEGLSAAGKEMIKTHKGLKEKKNKESATEDTDIETIDSSDSSQKASSSRTQRRSSKLEEAVEKERVALPAEAMAREYGAAITRPMREIYGEIMDINRKVEEKGYVNPEEGRRVEYLTGVVEEKFKAAEAGTYSFTEEAAQAASVTQQIGAQLHNLYIRNKPERQQKDWYKGR